MYGGDPLRKKTPLYPGRCSPSPRRPSSIQAAERRTSCPLPRREGPGVHRREKEQLPSTAPDVLHTGRPEENQLPSAPPVAFFLAVERMTSCPLPRGGAAAAPATVCLPSTFFVLVPVPCQMAKKLGVAILTRPIRTYQRGAF